MIAIDTSALMAIALDEPEAEGCMAAIEGEPTLLISAGTLAETLVVAGRRAVGDAVARFVEAAAVEVVPVTASTARRVAEAYARWGKGQHPAGLNLGDCFAYALAQERDCPLLFVGEDFARTDLRSAL